MILWPHPACWPPSVAPKLLFLHYVFWLGRHVYTRTCLHANKTQTAIAVDYSCDEDLQFQNGIMR